MSGFSDPNFEFGWATLKEEEESDKIEEARMIAQTQFVDLSVRHVEVCKENKRLRLALESAQTRAKELGELLREEV